MSLANAKSRAARMIASHESFIPHMYLDSVSYVTVGYGKMMPNANAAASLTFVNKSVSPNRPATPAEKRAEWQTIQARSPQGTEINYAAGHYRQYTSLEMTRAEGTALLGVEVNNAVAILVANYPGFGRFPEDAQVAMIDMAYNLGNRIHTVFRNFTRSINGTGGPRWDVAARESNRPQLSASRNREIYNLYMAAHRASQRTRTNP
ncbi:MAG: hypothetical protein ABJP70_07100 [Erythrobacter sp.]